MKSRRCPWPLRGSRGQSLVEFAIIVPVFLIALFGIIEFSLIITDQIILYNAARDGVRAGAVPAGQSRSAMQTAATNAATNTAGGLVSCKSLSVTPTFDNSAPAYPTQITVSLSCTYQPVTPLGALLGGTFNLNTTFSASATKMIEP
jgi:Flp pilus assembly protein TadG